MIRPAARPLSRLITSSQCVRASRPRRLISTAPPAQKSRSWKNRAVRFGIAATIIYYYNTTNLFAEGPELAVPAPPRSSQADEESDHPTLSEISAQKQKRKQASSTTPSAPIENSAPAKLEAAPSEDSEPQSAQEMEDEASQQGAFNPETGEINWDCPCLGGMANGPCGEEFKTAFSCFVYSTEEPKGVDCIDKFKGMQDCFRKHPDIYGDPDAEDDDEEEGEIERAIEESTDPGLQPESRPQPVASLASAGKNVAEKAEEKVEEVIKSHKD